MTDQNGALRSERRPRCPPRGERGHVTNQSQSVQYVVTVRDKGSWADRAQLNHQTHMTCDV